MRIHAFSLFGALALSSLSAMSFPVAAAADAGVRLWRLDCGQLWIANLDDMSDTHAYAGKSMALVGSCYLVRHGDRYLLWDTGLARSALGQPLARGREDSESLDATIVDQLAQIGVEPAQVEFVGISHMHFDHIGQAAEFPQATLLIGKGDLEALQRPGNENRAKAFAPWLRQGGKVEGVVGDRDVFGDGSVVMLDLPGHTPGHHGLLVRLQKHGTLLLTGDVAHFRENLATDGVPTFNADRAQSLASMDRFDKLADNLKATVIIQHDPRDVAKLPAFPQAAE